jgi:hypothetical protein
VPPQVADVKKDAQCDEPNERSFPRKNVSRKASNSAGSQGPKKEIKIRIQRLQFRCGSGIPAHWVAAIQKHCFKFSPR